MNETTDDHIDRELTAIVKEINACENINDIEVAKWLICDVSYQLTKL